MSKGFSSFELLVIISVITILVSIIYSGLEQTSFSKIESERYKIVQQYQYAVNLYNHTSEEPLPTQIHRIAQNPNLVGGLLVSSGILSHVPLDPVYFDSNNQDGFIWCNQSSDHATCLGDNDPYTFAIRFKTDQQTFLGPPGRYCATSKGFAPVGTGVSVEGREVRNSTDQCVQA